MKKKIVNYVGKFLPKNTFLRNVVTLASGSLFSQALTIVVSPILTRLYTPGDFGVYAYYTSILGIISVAICWRYELAIVIPADDDEAANLVLISVFVCGTMSLLVLILVIFSNKYIALMLNTSQLAKWLLFMPFSVLTVGLFQVFSYWCTRKKNFKALAMRQISQNSIMSIIQVGAGVGGVAGSGSLIGAIIAGQASAAINMGISVSKKDGAFFKTKLKHLSLKDSMIKYKNYPLLDMPSALVNSASTMLPPLLFGFFWNSQIAGYFSLAYRILTLPMLLIGANIGQVFFPHANEAKQKGNLCEITLDTFNKLLSISMVPLSLIAIVGPYFFSFFFGNEWYMSGVYTQWLVIFVFFNFVSSPISSVYLITGKQYVALIYNIFFLISRITVISICGYLSNSTLAIQLYGLLGGIFYLVFLCLILFLAKVSIWRCIKLIFIQIIYSIPFCIIPLLLIFISENSLLISLSGLLMGVIFLLFRLKCVLVKS